MRLAFAVTGIAAASAIATAIVAPPAGGTNGAAQVAIVATTVRQPLPAPSHVTRYVRLSSGQTAPPQASVQQLSPPAPRVVVVTTRQSGAP
jgi:hypothetical protein